ncbi:hypothetical protein [Cellulomonas sp. T2.31MG-18]|uniref:hypothetical protein n=1 Tax=Cellulomonas sp. T2.31MG-18 TaxID=3157619 RepID=UPI00366E6B85
MVSDKRSSGVRVSGSAVGRLVRAAAWAAVRNDDAEAMLRVATDPSADVEALATICPPMNELGRLPATVALAILEHPRCPGGLADRLSRHPDVVVRLAVVRHRGCGAMAQASLLGDIDPTVSAAAREVFSD